MSKIKYLKILKILLLSFVVIHICLFLYLIIKYNINMVYWDEWELSELIAGKTQFNLANLWLQHNEHRIFFPKIIIYLLARLTHWNVKYEVYLSVLLLFFTVYISYKILKVKREYSLFSISILILLILNFKQVENLIWGFQIAWIFVFFLFFSTYYLLLIGLNRNIDKLLIVLIILIASYSSMHGLLLPVYIILYSAFIIIKTEKRDKGFYLFLILYSVIIIMFYFYGWHKPVNHPGLFYFFKHPIETFKYMLVFIANVFVPESFWLGIVGILIVLFFLLTMVLLIKNKRYKFISIIIGNTLLILGIGFMLMIALGRAGFGYAQANSSRYATFSAVLNIGIFFFLLHSYKIIGLINIKKIILSIYVIFILLGDYFNINYSMQFAMSRYKELTSAKICILNNIDNLENCYKSLSKCYPDINVIKKRVLLLKDKKLVFFYHQSPLSLYNFSK